MPEVAIHDAAEANEVSGAPEPDWKDEEDPDEALYEDLIHGEDFEGAIKELGIPELADLKKYLGQMYAKLCKDNSKDSPNGKYYKRAGKAYYRNWRDKCDRKMEAMKCKIGKVGELLKEKNQQSASRHDRATSESKFQRIAWEDQSIDVIARLRAIVVRTIIDSQGRFTLTDPEQATMDESSGLILAYNKATFGFTGTSEVAP